MRSFVTWDVLRDSSQKGCYERQAPMCIDNQTILELLVEATLHTSPSGSMVLSAVKHDPALFPFELTEFNGSSFTSPGIEYIRHSLDNELVKIYF